MTFNPGDIVVCIEGNSFLKRGMKYQVVDACRIGLELKGVSGMWFKSRFKKAYSNVPEVAL